MIVKKLIPVILLIAISLTGCAAQKNNTPIPKTAVKINQGNIRSEVKIAIDRSKDYSVLSIQHTTLGIEETKIYKPEIPKEFLAGNFRIVFKQAPKSNSQFTVICQTEAKVGHLAKVIPGKTVINGSISIYTDSKSTTTRINRSTKLNTDEEKYFIDQLYTRFYTKMDESQADYINAVKDYAIAIYTNGDPSKLIQFNPH